MKSLVIVLDCWTSKGKNRYGEFTQRMEYHQRSQLVGGGNREVKILEEKPLLVGGVGEKKLGGRQYRQGDRIYDADEIAVALTAHPVGNTGGQTPLYAVKIPQATKEGYIECEVGGVADLSYPNSKTRRGRVQEGGAVCPTVTAESMGFCRLEPMIIDPQGRKEKVCKPTEHCPTLRAETHGNLPEVIEPIIAEPSIRIRKLTPKECWRLMGFDDAAFERAEKVNSNTQLYKQAGNSIVVDVLMAIFREML